MSYGMFKRGDIVRNVSASHYVAYPKGSTGHVLDVDENGNLVMVNPHSPTGYSTYSSLYWTRVGHKEPARIPEALLDPAAVREARGQLARALVRIQNAEEALAAIMRTANTFGCIGVSGRATTLASDSQSAGDLVRNVITKPIVRVPAVRGRRI